MTPYYSGERATLAQDIKQKIEPYGYPSSSQPF
jgi:hypothetical protein